ncbi:LuxR C-terminal-related transcriptional regulator [Streptomyces sp. KR80]|uniref:LuxR C-terminal-related transcriptional regulator n=1 Tax=Streptomyces sp. KR80 TaxID=3457426 RepID=UPI003FD43347
MPAEHCRTGGRPPNGPDEPPCPTEAGAREAAAAGDVYATLVERITDPGRRDTAREAEELRALPEDIAQWLTDRGLLDVRRSRLSAPERALRELLLDHEQQLRSAVGALARNIRAIDDVLALFPSTRRWGRETVEVEFFEDRDRLRKRLDDLDALSREEFVAMRNTFPEPAVLEASLVSDDRMLRQGVAFRMLVSAQALRGPGVVRYLDMLLDGGAAVRVVPALPLYMNIVDRAITVMAVGPDPHGRDGDVILHSPRLARCFLQVFEHSWDLGKPYSGSPASGRQPDAAQDFSPQEREVLALLAAGAKDESIARRLGCSERTLRRLMTQIAEKLGAQSRFAAGVAAARRGLVD